MQNKTQIENLMLKKRSGNVFTMVKNHSTHCKYSQKEIIKSQSDRSQVTLGCFKQHILGGKSVVLQELLNEKCISRASNYSSNMLLL